MTAGETSPDQLYAAVYGQPVKAEHVVSQRDQLESQLAQANDRGNIEQIEFFQEQLRQLIDATTEES